MAAFCYDIIIKSRPHRAGRINFAITRCAYRYMYIYYNSRANVLQIKYLYNTRATIMLYGLSTAIDVIIIIIIVNIITLYYNISHCTAAAAAEKTITRRRWIRTTAPGIFSPIYYYCY
jgi:hypothetical protein